MISIEILYNTYISLRRCGTIWLQSTGASLFQIIAAWHQTITFNQCWVIVSWTLRQKLWLLLMFMQFCIMTIVRFPWTGHFFLSAPSRATDWILNVASFNHLSNWFLMIQHLSIMSVKDSIHDENMTWKHFLYYTTIMAFQNHWQMNYFSDSLFWLTSKKSTPHHWPFVRESTRWPVVPSQRTSNAELY